MDGGTSSPRQAPCFKFSICAAAVSPFAECTSQQNRTHGHEKLDTKVAYPSQNTINDDSIYRLDAISGAPVIEAAVKGIQRAAVVF